MNARVRWSGVLLLAAALGAHVARAPVTIDAVALALVAAIAVLALVPTEWLEDHFSRLRLTGGSILGVDFTVEDRRAVAAVAAQGAPEESAEDDPGGSSPVAAQARGRVELAVADCGLMDIDREAAETLLARLTDRGWVSQEVSRTLRLVLGGDAPPEDLRDTFDEAARGALGRLRGEAFERAAADRFRSAGWAVEPHGVRGAIRVDFLAERDGRTVLVETKLAFRSDGKMLERTAERLLGADLPAGEQIVIVVPDRSRSIAHISDEVVRGERIRVLRLGEIE